MVLSIFTASFLRASQRAEGEVMRHENMSLQLSRDAEMGGRQDAPVRT